MANITHDTIGDLKPGEIVWDGDVKGFGARCQRDRKVYVLKTRHKGRAVWLTIGDTGDWTPKKARELASAWKRELRAGVNPDKLRASARGQPTIDGLCDRYLVEHVEPHNKASTAVVFRWLISKHVRPAWGKRLIADIDSGDVAKLHHKLRRTPRVANQLVAVLSKMFALAERPWNLRPLNSNPCKGLKRYQESVRKRVYAADELHRIAKAITSMEAAGRILPGAATAVRLAALTGMRRGEVLALEWTDVKLADARLDIRDAKAGDRTQTIGADAVTFLAGLERKGDFVCVGVLPDRPLSTRALHEHWRAVLTQAQITDGWFHDLRRSFATAAGSMKASLFAVRDVMGHKVLATTNRYVQKEDDPVKNLADRVAGRTAAAMAGKSAEVLPLKGGAA